MAAPIILSIQTGRVAPLLIKRGENDQATVMSGIRKQAVSTLDAPSAIAVNRLGLNGDEQSDLTVHGGLDKAVYVYPFEHYAFWEQHLALASPLPAGALGENLTISGLLETELWVGDEFHFGDCVLTVESPRRPCYKLNALLGSETVGKTMMARGFTGWYMSVSATGTLRAGEGIRLVPGPRHLALNERQRQMTRPVDLS